VNTEIGHSECINDEETEDENKSHV